MRKTAICICAASVIGSTAALAQVEAVPDLLAYRSGAPSFIEESDERAEGYVFQGLDDLPVAASAEDRAVLSGQVVFIAQGPRVVGRRPMPAAGPGTLGQPRSLCFLPASAELTNLEGINVAWNEQPCVRAFQRKIETHFVRARQCFPASTFGSAVLAIPTTERRTMPPGMFCRRWAYFTPAEIWQENLRYAEWSQEQRNRTARARWGTEDARAAAWGTPHRR